MLAFVVAADRLSSPAEVAALVANLDADVRDAIGDVDRSLIALALQQSPWDRLRSATSPICASPRQDPRWHRTLRSPTFLRCSRSSATPGSSSITIVGGAACVIEGAPVTTNDLDIVHRRTPESIERLLELLLQLDATMRYDFANRGLRPTAELLGGKGHLNLSTSLGPLDPLCELDGLGFDELLAHSQSVTDEGRVLRVLDLTDDHCSEDQSGTTQGSPRTPDPDRDARRA